MLEQGKIIAGRYQISDFIGRGGMAKIYKAVDLRLDRMVAIKVLNEEYSNDTNFIKRFNAEAKSAATISNPNIVNVYDVGYDSGLHFIVMELIDGITLKNYIESKGAIDSIATLKIAMQICMGIRAAHSNKIIHRDIKPQNIVISKDGQIKVADFGIARASDGDTITSNVVGSVHYISPEQARRGYSDEKSDIYSLGITLYEMVTGEVPFDGENNMAVIYSHINTPIKKPSLIVPDIIQGLEQIILKATNKHSADRYQSIEYMMQDIDSVLKNPLKQLEHTQVLNKKENYFDSEDDEIDGYFIQDDADDEVVNPKIKKIMNSLTIIGGVVFALLLLFIGYKFVFSSKTSYDPNKVPNIIGMKYDQVQSLAKKENFSIVIKEYDRNAPETEKDKILDQTPKPGNEWDDIKNKVLHVIVAGNDDVVIPDFSGKPVDQVMKQLENLKISASTEEIFSDNIEKGLVVKTNPVSGSYIEKNSSIILYISKGPDTIAVPDVRGMTKAEAESVIKKLGFNVIFEEVDGDKDKVISQSPEQGSKVPKRSNITLNIGNGKKEVEMPDLVNARADTAISKLNDLKLKVVIEEVDSKDVKQGHIVSTNPKGGEKIKEGDSVTVYISKGKGVSMPKVEGMSTSQAIVLLKNLGLGVSIREVKSETDAGYVISQSPAAGTIVEIGSNVSITVGKK